MSTPTLLLLPGLLCDAAVWHEQCDALARHACCVVPDFSGLDSIAAMATQVLASAPERFALAGHSMGGRVALEVVRQAPDRVERLALLDTGIDPRQAGPDGEAERDKRFALLARARTDGMRAMGEVWAQGMVLPAHRQSQVFEQILQMIERRTPDEFEAQIRALLARPDARDVFCSLRCPTLLLCGRQDAWSPLARHQAMHALLPSSELVVIEDSGHMTTMEQPAAVSEALRRWLHS